MSERKAIGWLNGVMFTEPKSDAQRKVVGGRLNFWSNEESIDKFCDQLKQMAKMHRDIGEDFLSIDIMRNDPSKKLKFDFKRSDYSPDDSLKQKVADWEAAGSGGSGHKDAEPQPADPFEDDDDLPF